MTTAEFLPVAAGIALVCYLLLAWHFTAHWCGKSALTLPRAPRIEHLLIGAALALHALTLAAPAGQLLHLGVGEAVSLLAWLTVLIYWITSWFFRMEGLQAPLMWMAGLGVAMGALLPYTHQSDLQATPLLTVHIVISLIAYSMFLLAALLAGLMLWVDKRLHTRQLATLPTRLPPLLALETLLFQLLSVAFLLLTVTVFTGVTFSEQIFGMPFAFTHKSVFSMVSWVVFALLLFGRSRYGWRGRGAARWTLAGMGTLMLAYLGSKIVLELFLHR